jgi:hypothetical protein
MYYLNSDINVCDVLLRLMRCPVYYLKKQKCVISVGYGQSTEVTTQ